MEVLGQYAISLVTTALICGILSGISPGGTATGLIRILCGLIMCLALLKPLANITLPVWDESPMGQNSLGDQAADWGAEMSRDYQTDIIIAACEAYILDKASEQGINLLVDIWLSDDLIPTAAQIRGDVSSAEQAHLAAILEKDLGIAKENQLWMK